MRREGTAFRQWRRRRRCGGEDFDDAALDAHLAACAVARADRWAAYEAAVVAHEGEVRAVLSMVPRGVYIHGEVGTGKGMLPDLFFESCQRVSAGSGA